MPIPTPSPRRTWKTGWPASSSATARTALACGAVVLRSTGEMVGQAGLTWQDCEGQPVLEVGYLLKKRFWHQGYASEAARACRDYAFRVLGAEKVSSIIKTDNLASIRVAQRNGMAREKAFTAHYYNVPVPHYLYTVWKDDTMDTTYCIEQLKALCAIDSPSGFTDRGRRTTCWRSSPAWATPRKRPARAACGCAWAARAAPLLLMAHVDTLGAVVQTIKGNGRLVLSPVGGLRAENCEAENCRIYTRFDGTYTGCLQIANASVHVNDDYAGSQRKFGQMEVVIDEPVKSEKDTRALGICEGDFVCFDPRTTVTQSGYIKSRFLDDKLSAAILLAYAKELKDTGTAPPAEGVPALHRVRGGGPRRRRQRARGRGGAAQRGHGLRGRGPAVHRAGGLHLRQGFRRALRLRRSPPPWWRPPRQPGPPTPWMCIPTTAATPRQLCGQDTMCATASSARGCTPPTGTSAPTWRAWRTP